MVTLIHQNAPTHTHTNTHQAGSTDSVHDPPKTRYICSKLILCCEVALYRTVSFYSTFSHTEKKTWTLFLVNERQHPNTGGHRCRGAGKTIPSLSSHHQRHPEIEQGDSASGCCGCFERGSNVINDLQVSGRILKMVCQGVYLKHN